MATGNLALKKVITAAYVQIDIPTEHQYWRGEKTEKDIQIEAETIIDQIKRHVDVPDKRDVRLVIETAERCPYCGDSNPLENDGSPNCCERLQIDYVGLVGAEAAKRSDALRGDEEFDKYTDELAEKFQALTALSEDKR